MDDLLDGIVKTEFVSICVCNPRLHRDGFWHTHVDYEVCLHTNSMCFRRKASSVRRRYSEFVWLRHCLEQNALIIELPRLPPWKPFFSLDNTQQVTQRMKGLQDFLDIVIQVPLLLSDSHLHLFLQSQLCVRRMERCARGQTRYTVAEAIQTADGSLHRPLVVGNNSSCYDSDCESSASSGLGLSMDTTDRGSPLPFLDGSSGGAAL